MKIRKFKSLSIRWKISIPVVIILVLSQLLVTLLTGNEGNKLMRESVNKLLVSETTTLESVVNQWNENSWAIIDAIYALPEVQAAARGGSLEEATIALQKIFKNNIDLGGYPLYANTLFLDSNFVVAASGTEGGIGLEALTIPPFVPNCEQARLGNKWISQVTASPVTGIMECWYSKPIFEGDTFLGMVVVPVHTQGLTRYLSENQNSNIRQYTFVADNFGMIASSTNPDFINKNISDLEISTEKIEPNIPLSFVSSSGDKEIIYMTDALPDTGWHVYSIINEGDAFSYTHLLVSILVSIIISIFATALVYFIVAKLLKPISAIKEAAEEMSKGNLNIQVRKYADDEIGLLNDSFVIVRSTISELVYRINSLSKSLEMGDIDATIDTEDFHGEYKSVAEGVNRSIGNLLDDTLDILDKFAQLGNGNFNAQLKQFPGKKILANNIFDSIKVKLSSFNADVTNLTKQASDGKLDVTVDESKYEGDWNKLAISMNNLLYTIAKPINETNAILTKLSEGNFTVSIGKDYKGSFAAMMISLDKMVESTSLYIEEITRILRNIADGDLTNTVNREYVGQYNSIKESINSINEIFMATIMKIQNSANNVYSGSKQVLNNSMALANGSLEQSNSIGQLSDLIEKMQEQFKETGENVVKIAHEMDITESDLVKTNEQMQSLMHEINEVNTKSAAIGKIIKTIDDIAFQTNILALNAAVEAARAGSAGKGFSVVAEEVRNLAGKSAEAARNTAMLIESVVNSIGAVVQNAEETAKTMNSITSITRKVAVDVNLIAKATEAEMNSFNKISVATHQISSVIASNSETSEESAAASEELSAQASLLNELISQFKI